MKEEVKELRIKIDGISQLVKGLTPISLIHYTKVDGIVADRIIDSNSNEINKCYDSLILAKAWLGKCLQELGTENPYGSGYKTKEDIEPTQDVAKRDRLAVGRWKEKLNHIEKVDWLRQEINKISIEVKGIDTKGQSREFAIARTNCFTHLSEARFWMEFELGRIRDENNKT